MADLDEKLCIARFLDGVPDNYIDGVIRQTVRLKSWGEVFDREEVIQNARLALLKCFKEGKYQSVVRQAHHPEQSRRGALTAFVQRITEFHCVNEMRRYYRTKKHFDEFSEEALEAPDPQGDPLTKTMESEEKAKAVRILIALDKPCRKLLYLKFYDGLSYKEMAEGLSMTEVNVRVSIFRCLKKSKEIAQKLDIKESGGANKNV
jgi:RNA polymerase sigma factor (sigma-70 family)